SPATRGYEVVTTPIFIRRTSACGPARPGACPASGAGPTRSAAVRSRGGCRSSYGAHPLAGLGGQARAPRAEQDPRDRLRRGLEVDVDLHTALIRLRAWAARRVPHERSRTHGIGCGAVS